ncbi:ECF RNA polymerase sigma factor SigK [Nocardia aurantia]|uniref:ECF RNA polymerase sigma factor SigK n=1 Tax=Nocardia aurantia TaxID=2585199 RepID=A0A7K0DN40_9NOCA|nr:ECF RNA polymerase sigma factor SigK [Nocardia aurantia]MQY26772.1 ECF RNA polymerase sigma factor SigK [Nocardia aurantia]
MTEQDSAAPARIRHVDDEGPPPRACPAGAGPGDPEAAAELAELVTAVAAGDRGAFTLLYRRTSHRVFGLAWRLLGNRASAEEISQEVYLQVWSLADRYDRRLASPMGWLMMLTHRRAVDRIRAERAGTDRDSVFQGLHLVRDHDVVAEEATQNLEQQAVVRCLGTLTDRQRDTITMAYYGGLTYTEVAQRLDTPVATVKSRIRDGFKRLSACLTGSDPR